VPDTVITEISIGKALDLAIPEDIQPVKATNEPEDGIEAKSSKLTFVPALTSRRRRIS
jgi:hypothetical protein